jgi:hypothetical protein
VKSRWADAGGDDNGIVDLNSEFRDRVAGVVESNFNDPSSF